MNHTNVAYIQPETCVGCGACIENCPVGAIKIQIGFKSLVNPNECIGCGKCVSLCHKSAPSFIKALK